MAKTLIVLGKGLALGCCRSDPVGLRLRLVGFGQMEKSGVLSFSASDTRLYRFARNAVQ
jgi:hypothetical protein